MFFDIPASGPVSDDNGPTRGWLKWFRIATDTCNSARDSGTTAQRPTENLWVGRTYFDISLGKPVWYSGSDWVDATGSSV